MSVRFTGIRYGMQCGEEVKARWWDDTLTEEEVKCYFNKSDEEIAQIKEKETRTGENIYVGEINENNTNSVCFCENGRFYKVTGSANVYKRPIEDPTDLTKLSSPYVINGIIRIGGFVYDLSTGEYRINQENIGRLLTQVNDMIKYWTGLKAKIVPIEGVYHLVNI